MKTIIADANDKDVIWIMPKNIEFSFKKLLLVGRGKAGS